LAGRARARIPHLDRLARSLKQLIETVEALGLQGSGLRSLAEAIDTTSSGGRLVFHLFAALAEFERGVIRERTLAGLQAARARGRTGGRPPCAEGQGHRRRQGPAARP
jgi:DNA invertase Pin-like site-specific DNA recombinase